MGIKNDLLKKRIYFVGKKRLRKKNKFGIFGREKRNESLQ